MKRLIEGALLVTTLTILGCPGNSASVLEGTWRAVFDEPGDLEGYDIQVTFDASGNLVQITAESPDGGTASLDVNANATETVIDGDQVSVTIPAAAGERVFEGTLSADGNSIDGSLSQQVELPSGDLEVTLPGSDLTLELLE